MNYPTPEAKHDINGVPGRMYPIHAPQLVRGRLVYRAQKWVSEARAVSGYGKNGSMHVEIRFDDQCGNAHQSFAITASVYTDESRRVRDIAAGGCMHEEIAKRFPELAPLIKWHLVSTDSPLHYIANALYHASDRDSSGRKAGEPCAWKHVVYFADSPVSHKIGGKFAKFIQSRMQAMGDGRFCPFPPELGSFQVVSIAHDKAGKPGEYEFAPKFTFNGFGERWHECPFDDQHTAQEWADAFNTKRAIFKDIPTEYSKGKARNLDAARDAACWPEATDEQLCLPRDELKALLEARLPALQSDFKAAMAAAGFMWEPEQPASAE